MTRDIVLLLIAAWAVSGGMSMAYVMSDTKIPNTKQKIFIAFLIGPWWLLLLPVAAVAAVPCGLIWIYDRLGERACATEEHE